MVDEHVMRMVDDALEGTLLNHDQALGLLTLDVDSAEAAYVRWASVLMGRRASGNVAQVYAQIGLDALPCPVDCEFCTLAASSSSIGVGWEVDDDVVVEYARVFDQAGVGVISLMTTAAYDFDHFVDVVRKVRVRISDDTKVMANIGDMNLQNANMLQREGVQLAYHAKRLGEGQITGVAPQVRDATIAAIREAGLELSTAVEPVSAVTPLRDVVDGIFEVVAMQPYCSGIGGLTAAPGTKMADVPTLSRRQLAHMACVMRLCAGESIPFGVGCGNVVWADAGTNPRGRDLSCDPDFLRRDVARLRKQLAGEGWTVK